MAERKPPGVSFETFIDKQIREATDRGEFDNLPGAGKPIPGLGKPRDEMWWVSQKLRRENLTYLPPSLALRKAAEDALMAAKAAGSESEVRQLLADINDKILAAIRRPSVGPPLNLMPFDIEQVVADWRAARPIEPEPVVPQPEPTPTRKPRWWRRR